MKYVKIVPVLTLILAQCAFLLNLAEANSMIDREIQLLSLFYNEKEIFTTASNTPRNVTQVPENIITITAEELSYYGGHTLGDVLGYIPGVRLNTSRDILGPALPLLMSTGYSSLLALIDGVRLNTYVEGSSDLSTIPLGIVERIEIIKGATSSVWGSRALSVINIITKKAGDNKNPKAELTLTCGEKETRSAKTGFNNSFNDIGYFVYAEGIDSDGQKLNRKVEQQNIFTKIDFNIGNKTKVQFNGTYLNYDKNLGDVPSFDMSSKGDAERFISYLNVEYELRPDILFKGQINYAKRRINRKDDALGEGYWGEKGDLVSNLSTEEKSYGFRFDVFTTWAKNNLLAGVEVQDVEIDHQLNSGELFQLFGAPATKSFDSGFDKWAVYINDAITFGKWTIIAGLRYDYDSLGTDIFSPGFGITYLLNSSTVLRGAISKGYAEPSLGQKEGMGIFLAPNKDLDAVETIFMQVGIDTSAIKNLLVKLTLNYKDVENSITGRRLSEVLDIYYNVDGHIQRGVDIEVETLPIYNFKLKAGYGYSRADELFGNKSTHSWYDIILSLIYDNPQLGLVASIAGNYVQVQENSLWMSEDKMDDIILDAHLKKQIKFGNNNRAEIFATAYNILNGEQYNNNIMENPGLWFEAGISIKFN